MPEPLPLIYARWCDVREQGPRSGSGNFILRRRIVEIQPVAGGSETGTIQYRKRDIRVYRPANGS